MLLSRAFYWQQIWFYRWLQPLYRERLTKTIWTWNQASRINFQVNNLLDIWLKTVSNHVWVFPWGHLYGAYIWEFSFCYKTLCRESHFHSLWSLVFQAKITWPTFEQWFVWKVGRTSELILPVSHKVITFGCEGNRHIFSPFNSV